MKVVQHLLVVACQNNTKYSKYRHSGKEIAKTLEAAESLELLREKAEGIAREYVSYFFKKNFLLFKRLSKTKTKILVRIKLIEEVNRKFPLSKLWVDSQTNEMRFSNSAEENESPKKVFNRLKGWQTRPEDLEFLKAQPILFFENFDFEKWLRIHSRVPRGFSKVFQQVSIANQDLPAFQKSLESLMHRLFNGEFGAKFKRFDTQGIFEFLPEFCAHLWNQKQLNGFIFEKIKEGKQQQEIIKEAVRFTETVQSSGKQGADPEHIEFVVVQAFK